DAAPGSIVGAHLLLAQRPQDRAGLRVNRGEIVIFASEMDRAAGLQRKAKVRPLAQNALQFRKLPCHRLGILPDVPAGPRAATDTLPRPEAARPEPAAGRGRQDRGVELCTVEE